MQIARQKKCKANAHELAKFISTVAISGTQMASVIYL
jgi:hypothetical protein